MERGAALDGYMCRVKTWMAKTYDVLGTKLTTMHVKQPWDSDTVNPLFITSVFIRRA